MEKARLIALLEKYWQAETTIAEERLLAEYFRRQDAPETGPDFNFAVHRDLFNYFGQEAQVSAGPGFESRILQHVGLSVCPARMFRPGFIAAAASISAIVLGIFLLSPAGRQTAPPIVSIGETSPAVVVTTVRDTYDDPAKALAAVRHALLLASTHLNEGRRVVAGDKK